MINMRKIKMNKKMVTLILVFTIFFGNILITKVSAENTGEIKIMGEVESVSVNSTIRIDVVVHNVEDLFGIQFDIKYDEAYLEYMDLTTSDQYNTYDGIQFEKGNIFLPFIRNNLTDNSLKENFIITSIYFKGKKAGRTNIALDHVKAINSHTYINEEGRNDLQSIPLLIDGECDLNIYEKTTTNDKKLTSLEIEKRLQELNKLISSNITEALNLLSDTLFRMDKNLFNTYKKQITMAVEKAINKHLELLPDDTNTLDAKIKELELILFKSKVEGLKLDNIQLTINMDSNTKHSIQLRSEDIKKLFDKGIPIHIASKGLEYALESDTLNYRKDTIIQMDIEELSKDEINNNNVIYNLINGYSMNIKEISKDGSQSTIADFNNPILFKVYYKISTENENKLGIYTFNEETKTWDFLSNARQDKDNNCFVVPLNHFSKYGVIEYTKKYLDLGNTYEEAKLAIDILSSKHIINGISEHYFAPNKKITRAEFTALIVKALQLKLEKFEGIFKDVKQEDWHGLYIEMAYKAGLINGKDEDSFRPNDFISREEIAVLSVRAYEYLGNTIVINADKFQDDNKIGNWAKEGVNKAKSAGLISGIGNNKFEPKKDTIRADAAVLIKRFLDKLQKLQK